MIGHLTAQTANLTWREEVVGSDDVAMFARLEPDPNKSDSKSERFIRIPDSGMLDARRLIGTVN